MRRGEGKRSGDLKSPRPYVPLPLLLQVPDQGEAASDPAVACLLVGMGVRDLSMNPFLAARVCHAIRQVTIDQTQTLAREALGATNPEDIQKIVTSALRGTEGF